MADSQLPKTSAENLTNSTKKPNFFELAYMKQFEELNRERVLKLLQRRRNSRILGTGLGLTALAIYSYTIYSMKQETFLDDFNEPEKVHD